MHLSLPSRLLARTAALVVAVSVTAVIVNVIAEIGHPPPDGFTVLNMVPPQPAFLAMLGIAPAVAQGGGGLPSTELRVDAALER